MVPEFRFGGVTQMHLYSLYPPVFKLQMSQPDTDENGSFNKLFFSLAIHDSGLKTSASSPLVLGIKTKAQGNRFAV